MKCKVSRLGFFCYFWSKMKFVMLWLFYFTCRHIYRPLFLKKSAFHKKPQSRKLNSLRLFFVGTDPPTFFHFTPWSIWSIGANFCLSLYPSFLLSSSPRHHLYFLHLEHLEHILLFSFFLNYYSFTLISTSSFIIFI